MLFWRLSQRRSQQIVKQKIGHGTVVAGNITTCPSFIFSVSPSESTLCYPKDYLTMPQNLVPSQVAAQHGHSINQPKMVAGGICYSPGNLFVDWKADICCESLVYPMTTNTQPTVMADKRIMAQLHHEWVFSLLLILQNCLQTLKGQLVEWNHPDLFHLDIGNQE
jgi:hypothetical protein